MMKSSKLNSLTFLTKFKILRLDLKEIYDFFRSKLRIFFVCIAATYFQYIILHPKVINLFRQYLPSFGLLFDLGDN